MGIEDCKSKFEDEHVYHIAAPRKQFFQVISKNLQVVNLGAIECTYEAMVRNYDITCSKFGGYGTVHVVESFTYENGQLISTKVIRKQAPELVVGFLQPDVNGEEISPGSFVINEKSLAEFFGQRLMRFSCQWGRNSPYWTTIASCSKKIYECPICQPCPAELTRKLSTMRSSFYPKFELQRVFDNAIVFKLSCGASHEKLILKKYETVCKFFDAQDKVYQPESCVSCWRAGRNCTDCWDAASLDGPLSSSLKVVSETYRHFCGEKTFIFQTNHGNVTFENGSLPVITKLGSHFYHIFQYDYIFGNYSAYAHESMFTNRMKKSLPNNQGYQSYLSKAVLLPGHQYIPTDLSRQQLKFLSTICRIRAVFKDNSVTKWSEPVSTRFSKNIFNSIALTVLTADFGFQVQVSQNAWRPVSQKDTPWSRNFEGQDLHFYIMVVTNSLFETKYGFSKTATEQKAHAPSHLYYADAEYSTGTMIQSNVHAKNQPLDMKCAALHPFCIWTEKDDEKNFRLFQVGLEKGSGKPQAAEKIELHPESLCACSGSNEKSITSSAVDIVYRDLSNPENVEIALVCRNVICLYHWKNDKSTRLDLPFFSLENKTATCLNVYQNFVFIVMDDNKAALHIIPVTDDAIMEQQTEFRSPFGDIRWMRPQIDPSFHLPVPFKYCIDPYVDRDETAIKMSTNSTILIHVGISWDSRAVCEQFSRAPVMVVIKYAKIPNYLNIDEDPGMPCASIQGLTCETLPKFVLYSSTKLAAKISDVVQDKFYLIDIQIGAMIDKAVYDVWYAGYPVSPSQTFRQVILTEFVEIPAYIWMIAVATVTLVLMVVVSGLFYWLYTRKMYMYRHLNRISAKDIQKEKQLGEGNFGEVWKATLGKDTIVVKMLKEAATEREEKEFREEALLLSKFNSDYIIRAVGICLQSRPIMLGLEFMNAGSLDVYLMKNEVRSSIQSGDLFQITEQALKGCIYLEQQGYIHRDIASRNCLVSTLSDTNVKPKCVKLSDFGLAKDIGAESAYSSRDPTEDTLPIAWTAPETFSGKFSPKSDVWSFGVLIWEVFSWASTPYGPCSDTSEWHICPSICLTHEEVEFQVCAERKTLLSFPDPCTAAFCDGMKTVVTSCWQFSAEDRPSFTQLQKYLNGAKKEILKTDAQMYFGKTGKSSVSQAVSSAIDSTQTGTSGKASRGYILQEAYRHAIEENPLTKPEISTAKLNDEVIELHQLAV